MAGWWELQRSNGVLMVTLVTETCPTKWETSMFRMGMHLGRHTSLDVRDAKVSGTPFDHGRNSGAAGLLADPSLTWLFFIDSDVCAPPDTIPRLISHGKDIVGGVYHRRAEPLVPCMLRYDAEGKTAQWITAWEPPGALIEADLIGTGCLLIHRRVFERMAKPWFRWELDPDLQPNVSDPRHSEDFSFCRRAKRDYGFQIFADTSIQCEHIGFGSSSAAGYRPAML